ncbi:MULTISPECIES: AMP-binding protein [unclassified Methylobacterium]|jgi:acyl-CoA synthetase (AMP-forming)/AMP-acid ligase II/drug/metabolite transporter (DMT)-like permease|uniref:AMP-binding protein n=1 Tax=unclassified Methylobacterium TaxID=2615210 RepID=UPI001354BD52|nr:AMP-binding protein [Methylobacterium sp. 2A]MWV22365.1 AMP-binding protein [Methylobacterium sp. 2A]
MIPLDRLRQVAAARGEYPALVTPDTVLTWHAFAARVEQVAHVLAGTLREREARTVCSIAPNSPDLMAAFGAAATLKLTHFGLDYSLSEEALRHLIDETDVDALIVSAGFLAERHIDVWKLANGRPVIDIEGRLHGAFHLSDTDTADTGPSTGALPSAPARAFRAVAFTSGTTGRPKPVIRTASFDTRRFDYFATRYGFSASDRHLVTIPLYHAAGNGWARLFLNLGATVVLAPPDDPATLVDLIRREAVTTSAMTPPVLSGLLRQIAESGTQIGPHRLRFVLVGGKHFPVGLKQEAITVLGPVVHEYYGTTETGVNTIAEPADLLTHPDSVGRAYDGNRIAIVDGQSKALPPGLVGSVAIASYMNMDGYLQAPSRKILLQGERYLVTSEVGHLDEAGRLYVHNRATAGETFDVYALENLIRAIPGIDDVALNVRAAGREKAVDIAVSLRRTSTWTSRSLEEHVRHLLKAESVRVERFALLDAIPYSPSGKVRHADLERALASVEPAVRRGVPRTPASGPVQTSLLTGALLLTFTTLSWGGMFPVAKSALEAMDGFYLTLFRYGFASAVLLALLVLTEGWGALALEGRGKRLFLLGASGFAGFSILAFLGLAHSTPEHGAIIMALMPLITAVLLWVLRGIRPAGVTFWCIAAALTGVVIVVTKGDARALFGGAILPDLVILAGATCWVAYTIGAQAFADWSPIRYTALTAALGTVSIALVTVVATELGFSTAPSAAQVWSVVPEILYLVVIAAVLAVFTWNVGIARLGPLNGVLFINLVPVTAFVIGAARGNPASAIELAGAALTIAALVANNLNARGVFKAWPQPRQEPRHEPRQVRRAFAD